MEQDILDYFELGKKYMDDSIGHLEGELRKITTGKANPAMFSSVMVDYYGNPTPLNQVASVTASDSRTITITPWEKTMLEPIERAIMAANLGVTPMNDGENVRINIPALTEERRTDLAKKVNAIGEDAKTSLRNARQKLMKFIKDKVKEGYPEDNGKRKENEVQDLINSYGDKVNKIVSAKSADLKSI